MHCKNHTSRSGMNTCSKCGEWICEECTIEVGGRNVCKECVEAHVLGGKGDFKSSTPVSATVAHPVNGFFVFVFSMLPGAAHMYMGLTKIGLFLMSLFFGSIILIGGLSHSLEALFGIVAIMVWVYSFFDARSMKLRIRAGEKVKDDISPYIQYVQKHKSMFAVILVVLGVLIIFGQIQRFMWRIPFIGSHMVGFDQVIVAVLLIFGGIYFLGRNKRGKDDIEMDMRNKDN